MNIVILGASQVGSTIAQQLVNEQNDITVVDLDAARLKNLQEHLDIRTIQGHAAYPETLDQAGGRNIDMLIAVTHTDEVNIVACTVAYNLFGVATKIARVRSSGYLAHQELFNSKQFPIDQLITPGKSVTEHIKAVIDYPNSLQVIDFALGKIKLVAIQAAQEGALIGQPLSAFRKHLPDVDVRVTAIYRNKQMIIPRGITVIQQDDKVFFVTAERHVSAMVNEIRPFYKEYQRIIIAGGGNIGQSLAALLENQYRVKIIEPHGAKCREMSSVLTKSVILKGNATDRNLLIEEDIQHTDVFCSLTNSDETNLMSALLAKQLGVNKTIALINNPTYLELIEKNHLNIDIVISPQEITISSLLSYIRRGNIVKAHSLLGGIAEVIETIVQGDPATSKIIGKAIEDISLPKSVMISAIARGNDMLMAHDNIVIEANDHLILFLTDKHVVHEVEDLFRNSE